MPNETGCLMTVHAALARVADNVTAAELVPSPTILMIWYSDPSNCSPALPAGLAHVVQH